MNRIFSLQNSIQPYAWGSRTAIADLLGKPGPTTNPQAELWMGAHPKASSKVWFQGRWQSLEALIKDDPFPILGPTAAQRFGENFPFLFKVLAVEQVLSIQAHPNQEHARVGFERENRLGIAPTSATRNYRDDRHKPECICALTPFWALCGFRSPKDIYSILSPIWPPAHVLDLESLLKSDDGHGLRSFFRNLMKLPKSSQQDLTGHVAHLAQARVGQGPVFDWIVRLNEAYPGDIGAIAPALLNLICLQPEEALFLPPGQLHTYLNGLGIELMANSDNVIRGGLTTKHIEIDELITILDFQYQPLKVMRPLPINNTEARYPSGAEEFVLSVIKLSTDRRHAVSNRFPGPEILLCTQGETAINWEEGTKKIALSKGQAVLVAAGVNNYDLIGNGVIYKAALNLKDH